MLTGFQEVEDNLAALRILEHEADAQTQAVELADQSLAVMINEYRAGTVAYLNVITAQTILLSNKIAALNILGRRMIGRGAADRGIGGRMGRQGIAGDVGPSFFCRAAHPIRHKIRPAIAPGGAGFFKR